MFCSHILDSKRKALNQDLKAWNKEVVRYVSTNKAEALNQIGLWDVKEREQGLSAEESEARRGAVKELTKWPVLKEISWR